MTLKHGKNKEGLVHHIPLFDVPVCYQSIQSSQMESFVLNTVLISAIPHKIKMSSKTFLVLICLEITCMNENWFLLWHS